MLVRTLTTGSRAIFNDNRSSITFGFEHFPVGPGTPVLVVYGEGVYRALLAAGLGLYRYTKVALPEAGDGDDDDAELALLFCKLASRAAVIWPEAVDDGHARALRHAPTAFATRGLRRTWPQLERDGEPPAPLRRDITCDGSVMAEMAEICRCDAVMDRIASDFALCVGEQRIQGLVPNDRGNVKKYPSWPGLPPALKLRRQARP